MFIHGNFSMMPANHTVNAYDGHRSMPNKATALQAGRGLRPLRDTLTISPDGKANSALSGLEKLKQQIEDRRSEFVSKAMKDGQPADVIKNQLDAFDQQLKDIDQQIAKLTMQQMSQNVEKAKNVSSAKINRPRTRQDIENERLADITSMSVGLDRAEAIHTVKTQVDGDIGIQEAEIELEKSRNGDTAEMEAELSTLQGRAEQLTAGINDQLEDTLEEIQESNDKMTNADGVEPEETEHEKDDGLVDDHTTTKAQEKGQLPRTETQGKESGAVSPSVEADSEPSASYDL